MEKPGEKLNPNLFTFKYPGREPKYLDEFLSEKPEVLNHYIYDINLTTGKLLYLSKGGIGATKELYIARMHEWIQTSTIRGTLESVYKTRYRNEIGKWKYNKLKEKFNESSKELKNWTQCAELYLLWMGSNFTHRYRDSGYDGIFFPTKIDNEALYLTSQISREKGLLFRREDLFSFKESVINDNVIVYSHLPREFGRFGAGWIWNKERLEKFTRVINELSKFNYKILISAPFELRGRIDIDYRTYFEGFNYSIVQQFKETKSFLGSVNSEIYFFNF